MGKVSMTVNGKTHEADVEPRLLLVHFLREHLNLTGTHVGWEAPCRRTQPDPADEASAQRPGSSH